MLESRLGVFLAAGLFGGLPPAKAVPPLGAEALEDGTLIVGLLPARVDSDGFFDQENIFVEGIFQPLLQPTCVAQSAQAIIEKVVQCAILVRITNQSFDSINPVRATMIRNTSAFRYLGKLGNAEKKSTLCLSSHVRFIGSPHFIHEVQPEKSTTVIPM